MLGAKPGTEEAPAVYAESYFPQFFMGWAPLRSIRVGRWKYIEAPSPELYDLATDAAERVKVVTSARETVAQLAGALDRTLAALDPYFMQIRLVRQDRHA